MRLPTSGLLALAAWGCADPSTRLAGGDHATEAGVETPFVAFGHAATRDAVAGFPPDDASADDASTDADDGGNAVAVSDVVPIDDGAPGAEADESSTDASHEDATANDANPVDAPTGSDASTDCPSGLDHPLRLKCTGLYSDWTSRSIAPGVRPFEPGLALWSDGADKNRWIQLPPGSAIDTSDMDEWVFPIGTKLWKEFRLAGQPVETRFLWKRSLTDWFKTTYVWTTDGSDAGEVTAGVLNVYGGTYEIPPQAMCTTCHQGRLDTVLGFEAVSLSAPNATGLTVAQLVREGLLSNPPSGAIVVPGNATESAALGWLHANCGTACHNRSLRALAGATGLLMRLEVANTVSVQGTDTWTTALAKPSNFQPNPTASLLRIDPGNPGNSAISFRDSTRDDQGQGFQMPPIDTHLVPSAGVALVQAWIASIPPSVR
jgi:hypothetical protein